MARRVVRNVLISVFALAALQFGATSALIAVANAIHDPHASGAVAVVFYGDRGERSRLRVAAAVELSDEERVDSVLMIGGARPEAGFNGAAWMAGLGTAAGLRSNQVRHGALSFDTVSNVDETLGSLAGARSVVIVSDCLHALRIEWLMRHKAPTIRVSSYCRQAQGGWGDQAWRAQHEFLAWTSLALPRSVRENLIGHWRGQGT